MRDSVETQALNSDTSSSSKHALRFPILLFLNHNLVSVTLSLANAITFKYLNLLIRLIIIVLNSVFSLVLTLVLNSPLYNQEL